MTIEKAITKLWEFYRRAVPNKYIHKPVSWALFQTWKWTDAHEEERGRE